MWAKAISVGEKAEMRAKRQATWEQNDTTFQEVGRLRKKCSPNEKATSHAKRLASHAASGTSIGKRHCL